MQNLELTRKIAEFLAKPKVKEMSAGLEEIAQAVAVAVEDKVLTQRIYEKCLEKFDGETNTLWMHLEADSKLKTNGNGWNKRIDAELGKGRKNAVVKGIGNVDVAIKKFEKTMNAPLHLFWAFPQNWDKTTTPIVVFVPFDAEFKKSQELSGFDASGTLIKVSESTAKQRPVIVLTVNERTQLNGELRKKTEVFAQTGKNAGRTNSGSFFTFQGAYFPYTLEYYEGWFMGEPEFLMELRDNLWGSLYQTYSFFQAQIPLQTNWYPNSPIYLNYAPNGTVRLEWWEQDFGGFEGGNDYCDTHYISPSGSSGSQGSNPQAYYVIQ